MTRSKKIPNFMTEQEFWIIIKSYLSKSSSFSRIRNVIIFMICFYMGLRPKEAQDIKEEHVNWIEKSLYIPAENNKQRNQDLMPIQDFLIEIIRRYKIKKDKKFLNSPYLFPANTNSEKSVYRGTLIRAFTEAIFLANFKQVSYIDGKGKKRLNYSLYSLRHSFGTYSMHELKDLKLVAKLLRHYDPQCRSTNIYNHTDQLYARREILSQVSKKWFLNNGVFKI